MVRRSSKMTNKPAAFCGLPKSIVTFWSVKPIGKRPRPTALFVPVAVKTDPV